MLKQNKFISIIAIMGTALAIMMIMAIIVTDEVRNISISPENNRNRTYYITGMRDKSLENNSYSMGNISKNILQNYISEMKTPELISANTSYNGVAGKVGSNDFIHISIKLTDFNHWKFFSFTFLEGRPYNEAEFESGVANAVISESVAKKLFQGEKALGEMISINFEPFRVIGIVKDVSSVFTMAKGDIWIPYTVEKNYNIDSQTLKYSVLLLAKENRDFKKIEKELRDIEKKYQVDNPTRELTLGGPVRHRIQQLGVSGVEEEEVSEDIKAKYQRRILIFMILLLVPAINLSGLSLSRLKKRIEEIGVRKAFGAKRHHLLLQVLFENLITSFIGGIIGLLFSFFIVIQMKNWLLKIPDDNAIPFDALISIPVFLAVFIICIIINLLSAGIPAYRASRMPIVDSLNKNDK